MAQTHTSLLLLTFLLTFYPRNSFQGEQHQKISTVDLNALIEIKNSLRDMPGTRFLSNWNIAAPDPCATFDGVTCSSLNRVTTLTLGTGLAGSRGLTGSLSPSLSQLTELTQLILFPGTVTGFIPPQLGQLKNLRVISLTNNRLSGPIPSTLSNLPNLHTLDLSYNLLTGSVPPSITGLSQLKVLILASNRLWGALPAVSTQLLHLDLKQNRFWGRLPSMPLSLRYLSLSENSLWGPINGLESLSELVYLDLGMNQFTGAIPDSLIYHVSLSSMFLQRNNLSGRIPDPQLSESSSYGPGSIVDLSHNFLTGELPVALAGVETLFVNNNRLTGKVPGEYVDSVFNGNTKTLYLQHNYLSGFPLKYGSELPDSVSLCLSDNCMVPPAVGLTSCPASAGGRVSRPQYQCSPFKKEGRRG